MNYTLILDTNILVSFVLSTNPESPIRKLRRIVDSSYVQVMYTSEIYSEYERVLSRPKFDILPEIVQEILESIKTNWTLVKEEKIVTVIRDPKDLPFYYLVMSEQDSYLVTGNLKHFPHHARIVSPREFVAIYDNNE